MSRHSAPLPLYRGALRTELTGNSPFDQVLDVAVRHRRRALESGSVRALADAELALAEAHRRLGQIAESERAWKASFRAARRLDDHAGMAWALWCGGTLARQRGALALSQRWLRAAVGRARRSGDADVLGYARAGYAETGRIRGDYPAVLALHQEELDLSRARGDAEHAVWALLGIAQIHRNTGAPEHALTLFHEAAEVADEADYRAGHAWALRGIADLLSEQGRTAQALELLDRAALTCRTLRLTSAWAYNRKMYGNVLYRDGRYPQAADVYRAAHAEFEAMGEQRGAALARLGLVKSLARTGRPAAETAAALDDLHTTFQRIGLLHARTMVEKARADFGLPGSGPTDFGLADSGLPGSGPVPGRRRLTPTGGHSQ
ncbi:tetratricopeptide repeat protein [Streptomyces sp. NPDC051567]|uniref:tetratricopeptide repeat protein n=1 Tax=Streptomyces sp. NPDC051567 TaxID=3365660 RepID=UPI0037883631